MTFTEMFNTLVTTHPEWSRRMCVIAARYYLGVETAEDLTNRTLRLTSFGPSLTTEERNDIIRWR
ncbi:MAG: hypothetical protein ACXAEN_23205 [Candidatus Thorarchaeota archaeon]|jgi:hypothetical protein